ncbi:IS66 family transposase [Solirhodobacter olei]|uniref:IS66 family transposase n=1 Tax=Solirhodobacter olei TaxID=2493082 RepID=UPI000FD75DB8|nr:transposase [Solirhodobacter olei]
MAIRFVEDGRLELDTNPVENQICKIASPRKSALFADTRSRQRTGLCSPALSSVLR